jgi:VanZ family protein
MYGVLGWLTARAVARQVTSRRAMALAALAISLFGAADEWHQQFVPGRSADRADWLADTVGAALGITLAVAARPRREQHT